MKIIEVENLVKKFGSFVANDHLTFSVEEGEIYGFLGANGAGKTTAMKILCGLSAPTSGKVKVAGFDIYHQAEMIKKKIFLPIFIHLLFMACQNMLRPQEI